MEGIFWAEIRDKNLESQHSDLRFEIIGRDLALVRAIWLRNKDGTAELWRGKCRVPLERRWRSTQYLEGASQAARLGVDRPKANSVPTGSGGGSGDRSDALDAPMTIVETVED
jgi:hypothetical protein